MKSQLTNTSSSGKKQTRMNYEYADVVIEIFIRLPLKSLLRFRSVCKWWKQIISDPLFISNYSRLNTQHRVSGFYLQKFQYLKLYSELRFVPCTGREDAVPMPSLSFILDEHGVRIQHSCNGLLLCSSFRCSEKDRTYYVCKPTTKQYVALPGPQCKTVHGISIAFDPENSSHYQVICVADCRFSEHHRQIKVYSSFTGCWRDSGSPFVVLDDFLFDRGVLWNGSLHWVSRGESSLRFVLQKTLLLRMPMPPIPEGWVERRLGYFGESGGHLYLIEIYGPQTTVFDVMEMNSDYSGWFVKYHVNFQGLPALFPWMVRDNVRDIHRYVFSVLLIVHRQVDEDEEEEEEDSILVLHIPGNIIPYNLRTNTLMELHDLSPHMANMEGNRGLSYAWESRNLGLCYKWDSVHPYNNTLCYF